MLLRLQVVISDPNTGQSQIVAHMFDTGTANAQKWDNLFPEVQAAAAAVVAAANAVTPSTI